MTIAISLSGVLLLVLAAAFDLRERTIPNGICVALAAVGVVRLLILMSSLETGAMLGGLLDVIASGCLFFVGAGLFAAGCLGGGDVKLQAAAALWLGWQQVPEFLFAMTVSGGVLALVFLASHTFARASEGPSANPDMPKLPYGFAIAVGGLFAVASI
ncbi:MAG: prepilin peptidase [Pseudomonadota bacterium]